MTDLKITLLDDGREFVPTWNAVGKEARARLVEHNFVFRNEPPRRGWFRSPTRSDGKVFG